MSGGAYRLAAPLAIGVPTAAAEDSGVGIYSAVLKRALAAVGQPLLLIDDLSARHHFPRPVRLVYAARPWRRTARRSARAIAAHDLFREAQVYFDIYGRPLELGCDGPRGIAHWTYPVPLRLAGWRNVYTVHDIIPLKRPDLSPIDPRRHGRLLRVLCHSAAAIVTVSEHARQDFCATLEAPPPVVVNLGQAVDVGDASAESPLPPALCGQPYLLCCGSLEPRKNIARLIEAYRLSGVATPLVFAGSAGVSSDTLVQIIAATPGACWLGRLPRGNMLALMREAGALLMPSLAEGFGLPVAEALAMGVPVMTSRGGALEEIAGGRAALVDPEDTFMIAACLRRIAEHAAEGRRHGEADKRFAMVPYAERLIRFYGELSA